MDSIVDDALEGVDKAAEADADGEPAVQPDSGSGADTTASTPSAQSPNGISDDELRNVLSDMETTVTVVGCGGGGCNTVDRMVEEGIHGANLVALNTDVQHLLQVEAEEKHLIGKDTANGRGAGSLPQQGEKAALEDQDDIKGAVNGSDMVFVTAGLGGGTGTGAAPVVAKAAKDAGALTIAVVTLPFTSEGEVRRTNAEAGLERLRGVADTVIVVPNDRLLDTVGNLPLQRAFKVCDEVLMRSVKGITELITKPGLVNLDFADVRTVMEGGGVAMIGLGESETGQMGDDALDEALSSPLLDVDISNADSVLVNVTGGDDMAIEEAEAVVENIHGRVSPDARIIWGTSVDEEYKGKMQTMLVVTGVESPQIIGNNDSVPTTMEAGNGNAPTKDASPEAEEQVSGGDSEEQFGDIDYIE